MTNVYETLFERGFIQQATHEKEIKELLAKEKVTFYIGFDPTADSLTVGHFLTVMAMTHMQRAGHRPIILVGGGTGMVGDPTDKTEMRRVMSKEEVRHNSDCFKAQLSKFIDFSEDRAIMADNADWLMELKYVQFIREYGIHFSVNRMLTADAYRTRFEKGLTFFEFNYMLMQSYDFLELYRRHNCKIQMGGNDQWSNILGGVELIRRVENAEAYGLTFTLLTTSEGKKMGKSQQGAVWLDASKTSPYDFFQYWRNVDDADVGNCLRLLTFLPLNEINGLTAVEGSKLNHAKEVLAYEITKLVHGEDEAKKALLAARALFGGAKSEGSIPAANLSAADFGEGMNIIEFLDIVKLCPTRSESRRLIEQGGLKLGDKKITDVRYTVTSEDFTDNKLLMQKGKKTYLLVSIS